MRGSIEVCALNAAGASGGQVSAAEHRQYAAFSVVGVVVGGAADSVAGAVAAPCGPAPANASADPL